MLQQPPALRPFMQELIPFTDIARRASQHKVAWVICSIVSQWNNMIDVVSPPTSEEWLAAVVACAALNFQHTLNILYRIFTTSLQLAGASCIRVLCFVKATAPRVLITPFVPAGLFGVFMLPLCYTLQLRIFIACKPLLSTLWVCWLARLPSTLTIRLFSNLPITRTAMIRKFITSGLEFSKELRSWGIQHVALAASLFPINIALTRLSPFAKAVFTAGLQSIGALLVLIEELKGSGVKLFAVGTLFLYTIHTERLTLFSSRPGVYQHRSGKPFSFIIPQISL